MKTKKKEFLKKTMLGDAGRITAFFNLNKEHKGNKKKVPKNKIGVSPYSF